MSKSLKRYKKERELKPCENKSLGQTMKKSSIVSFLKCATYNK